MDCPPVVWHWQLGGQGSKGSSGSSHEAVRTRVPCPPRFGSGTKFPSHTASVNLGLLLKTQGRAPAPPPAPTMKEQAFSGRPPPQSPCFTAQTHGRLGRGQTPREPLTSKSSGVCLPCPLHDTARDTAETPREGRPSPMLPPLGRDSRGRQEGLPHGAGLSPQLPWRHSGRSHHPCRGRQPVRSQGSGASAAAGCSPCPSVWAHSCSALRRTARLYCEPSLTPSPRVPAPGSSN